LHYKAYGQTDRDRLRQTETDRDRQTDKQDDLYIPQEVKSSILKYHQVFSYFWDNNSN